MVDLGRPLGLPLEPCSKVLVGAQRGSQQLERDLPPEAYVLGEIDDAHPSAADQRLQAVARNETADAGIDLVHGPSRLTAFIGT